MGPWDSDYGSGTSSNTQSSWTSQEKLHSYQPHQNLSNFENKSSSLPIWKTKASSLDDVMQEFQMNGVDSPYDPDCENLYKDPIWGNKTGDVPLSGLGPSGAYLRQKSCPEPPRSSIPLDQRPRSVSVSMPAPDYGNLDGKFSGSGSDLSAQCQYQLTENQARVLTSLPDATLYALLRAMQQDRRNKTECRFCKNNGEREWYYTSHVLKDSEGRVSCPVLRALVCRRCGAHGDNAHTIKYCPLSTNEERITSSAIMRSVRLASGKRRHSYAPSTNNAQYYAALETAPSVDLNNNHVYMQMPLEPVWAALEQKLIVPKVQNKSISFDFSKI